MNETRVFIEEISKLAGQKQALIDVCRKAWHELSMCRFPEYNARTIAGEVCDKIYGVLAKIESQDREGA